MELIDKALITVWVAKFGHIFKTGVVFGFIELNIFIGARSAGIGAFNIMPGAATGMDAFFFADEFTQG